VATRDYSVRCDSGPLIPPNWYWLKSGRLRYAFLNLFHAASQAASEGRQLLPDSVLKIRDRGTHESFSRRAKLLDDFFASEGKERARVP
jgi:hypothetical protein